MDVTLPNGVVIRGVPEGTTKDQIMQKAIASGMATAEDFGSTKEPTPAAAQEPEGRLANEGMYEGAGGLRGGFMRGVEQTLGGMGQRLLEINKRAADEKVQTIMDGMKSGEIPVNEQTIAELQAVQGEAVKFAQGLAGAERSEQSSREQYAPIAEENPISSTVGNVAGQIAALPVPAMRASLPIQMGKGALEGAAAGYSQATVGEETPADAAGIGGLVGGIAPAALRPLETGLGAAFRGATSKPSGEASELIDYAAQRDLPLMTTDLVQPKTAAGRQAQAAGEKIPLVGTGARRAQQQESRQALVKELQQTYGVPSDDEIYRSLISKKNRVKEAAGNRYNKTIDAMADTPIPLDQTVRAIDEQIAKYTRPGAASNDAVISGLQKFKEQVTSGENDLSLLRQNRTLFREMIKGPDGIMSDSAKRANDAVYNAITLDMTRGVADKLGPAAAREMRQADAIWARESAEVKNTKLKNIFAKGEIKPEEATKMLFSGDKSEVTTLFNALDSKGRSNARAAIIARAFDKAQDSPEKFLSEMNRLRSQSEVFFRGQDRKALNGAIKYLRATSEASQAGVRTKTGQELMQFGVPLGVVADVSATGGVGTATIGTIGALSSIYESPAVRNIMVRLDSTPRGSTQFEKLTRELESALESAATRISNVEE